MLEYRSTISPEEASRMFFHGLSMDQSIITGSNRIDYLAALKGRFNLVYCILVAPIALVMRKISEQKVNFAMKHY